MGVDFWRSNDQLNIIIFFILATFLLCDNFALINNAAYEYISATSNWDW